MRFSKRFAGVVTACVLVVASASACGRTVTIGATASSSASSVQASPSAITIPEAPTASYYEVDKNHDSWTMTISFGNAEPEIAPDMQPVVAATSSCASTLATANHNLVVPVSVNLKLDSDRPLSVHVNVQQGTISGRGLTGYTVYVYYNGEKEQYICENTTVPQTTLTPGMGVTFLYWAVLQNVVQGSGIPNLNALSQDFVDVETNQAGVTATLVGGSSHVCGGTSIPNLLVTGLVPPPTYDCYFAS